ncbi:uncharacterized protein LOC134445312 [Engraulis encrasicolus]|uniref:uncharacterized protein LOC134445312 n=1 Tax=Engraulis encrasicolus TaxID=184585 RepID=UPI002FD62817
MGLSATGGCRDFSSLDTERSHFLLKQQQKQLASNPDLEQLYVEVALLHTLATVKELLLQCGVSNACDYLAKAKKAHETEELDRLHKRVLLLQCLGQKNSEPDPKLTQLQAVMSTWLQAVSTRPGLSKVLLLTSTNVDSLRSLLIGSLNQISGEGVVDAVVPTGDSSYVDGKKVLNCLRCSSWVVVCSQHLGPDFPWSSFSQVVEYEGLASSPWPSICRERNIRHVSFTTILPTSETGGVVFPTSCTDLDRIPFTLFVTEGLLGRSSLLLTLESEYNLTMIERSLSPSLRKLGKADQCAVITVDESTAVLLQEVKELTVERASEQVVMRLIGLSLQYTCCWLLIHIPSAEYACISQVILDNLALIYSAVVLLGMKSEEFTVKVLVVSEEEQLARWIYQIAQHTMMSSERDPLAYLDRDWLSVVPSEEENCLVCFPSVSPLVAQTMLHRAPSLLWLLGASLDQLQQLLPEVPQKVIKLFTETSGLYALGPSPHRPKSVPDPESQHRPQPGLPETGQATGHTSSSSNSTHEHWALTIENSPEEDQTTSCFGQTQNNTGQDGVALFGSSGTGQADAFFQRIENLGQTQKTNGGLNDDVWASALKTKPAEELSGAYYSHEPQRDGFLLNNTAVGERQGDALFHKGTGNFVQTGNFGTSPSEAFFDKTNGWREKKSFSPSPNGVFQRQEENGKTVRGHQGDSIFHKGTGNFGVSPTDSFFDKINGWREKDSSSPSPNGIFQRQEEDRGKTVSFTAGQSYGDFERRADFAQAGNSSVRQSEACFDGKESWEQTDRFNAGQSATDFMRQENSGKTGHFSTGQNSEFYPRTGNIDQTVNLSAGPSDDVFSRNKITGWGLASQSSGASALFQTQEAWGKTDESQFNSGITSRQSDSYFDQTEGWGHMARSDPVHSQWNPFLQSNKDRWEQTGNFSTGCQSDTSFPWKESFAQTGNSVGLGHDVFLPHSGRNNTWDKNSGHAELGFPSATFRSPTETTATTASRQQQAQAQPKQWHMEINKHKYVPRKKVPARGGSTLRISPKQDDQGTRDAQDNNSNSSMFQQQFTNGCQPSSYYQDHVAGSLPVGPVNSVCSSPVSRWTGQFMAEAYRLSPGNSVGSATRMEQDRKRRAGMSSLESPASGFPQTKKGKLFYERVPGRSDGQTRLKFF